MTEGNVLTEQYLGVVFWSGPDELTSGVPLKYRCRSPTLRMRPPSARALYRAYPLRSDKVSIVGFGTVNQRDAYPTIEWTLSLNK